MKAFLMFRNIDFNMQSPLPPNSPDLIQDLELNSVLNAMSMGDKFLYDIARVAILSSLTEPNFIRYRQEVLQDCLNHRSVIREMYQIPIEATEGRQRRWLGIFTHTPGGVLISAVELMNLFVELLKKLKKIADEHHNDFHSEGFITFFEMIDRELDDDYFTTVEYHLKQLRFHNGVLISAELGKGNEGDNYTLRQPNPKNKLWIKDILTRKSPEYSFTIDQRDDAGARALEEIKDRGVNSAANSLAQAAEHIENFFKMLRIELAFYIGCINLKEQLDQIDCPTVFPVPMKKQDRSLSFKGLYDVCLALTIKQKIVGNEINADYKNLVIITGANQGGKSTFLRSIGLAQLLMQAGMFVPAVDFSSNICLGLYTHYKRKEDPSMKSGKLDEELNRMSAIIDVIKPDSLILFNESFASTNEREGSEIARQITSALLDRRIKVFYVTHMFEFAHSFYDIKREDAIFLSAERKSGGKRTYKIVESEPLSTSFGMDLFHNIFE
jgi:DNA mismatch repair ATPase MutS